MNTIKQGKLQRIIDQPKLCAACSFFKKLEGANYCALPRCVMEAQDDGSYKNRVFGGVVEICK